VEVIEEARSYAEHLGADATISYVIRDPVTGDIAALLKTEAAGR